MAEIFRRESTPERDVCYLCFRIDILKLLRHVASEGLKHRAHSKAALPLQNLLLELHLVVYPVLRKRAVIVVDVAHTVPRKMGRTGEIRAYFLVRKAVPAPDLLPHRLLAGVRQRHINAVEGHPVDEPFPILPLPPRHRVAEGAIVEEKPVLYICTHAHGSIDGRHIGRIFNRFKRIPRNCDPTVVLEVVVESRSH